VSLCTRSEEISGMYVGVLILCNDRLLTFAADTVITDCFPAEAEVQSFVFDCMIVVGLLNCFGEEKLRERHESVDHC